MSEQSEQIVQGDVFLTKVIIPKTARKQDHFTLALGEATGHHHSVVYADQDHAKLYMDDNGTLYLRASKPITVEHQEHKPINVPAGDYLVGIVNEYDPFTEETRRVED